MIMKVQAAFWFAVHCFLMTVAFVMLPWEHLQLGIWNATTRIPNSAKPGLLLSLIRLPLPRPLIAFWIRLLIHKPDLPNWAP
jgi:hypothetical protein